MNNQLKKKNTSKVKHLMAYKPKTEVTKLQIFNYEMCKLTGICALT